MITIDQQIIDQASALNLAGDYVGAYQVLSGAGDTYSTAAAGILGNNDGYFQGTVQRLWDNVRPGSVSQYWDEVAGRHQANYIALLNNSGGVLPST